MTIAAPSEAKAGVLPVAGDQTVGSILNSMTRAFSDAGIESAHRDARFLLQSLAGIEGASLLARPERELSASLVPLIEDAMRRRLAREPVSRILGVREFYGRNFVVTPAVLDPRPETETVVDLALEIIRSRDLADKPLHIADIGTGSGVLIATLLAELPLARGTATDISASALAIARKNADRLGVGDRVDFVATRGLDDCPGPFDLVVSNPPYIQTTALEGLDREVRDYDPRIALDGGPDGLQIYREIARNIVKLQQSRLAVLEVGAGQAADVENIFASEGWSPLGRKNDLGGHARSVALEIHR